MPKEHVMCFTQMILQVKQQVSYIFLVSELLWPIELGLWSSPCTCIGEASDAVFNFGPFTTSSVMIYAVFHTQITWAYLHVNICVVTNPPPFYPSVTQCGSTREAMLLCSNWWVTQRGVHAHVGEQLQLARSTADEVYNGLHESILFFSDPAKSRAFLWSQWSLQRNFPTPAIPWLRLMLVITVVGISWIFVTSHLKYHQLNSFFLFY